MHPVGGQRDRLLMETHTADVYAVRRWRRTGSAPSFVSGILNLEGSGEMTYFVTGATGFIGRHLLERLLQRKGRIY